MKKLLIVLICLIGICARGWAQKSGGPIEGAMLGRALGEAVAKQPQITRDDKDFRILYFLGEEYKMHLGSFRYMYYFNADRDGVLISKKLGRLQRCLYDGIEIFEQTGYTLQSQDGRNSNDIIYSVYKEEDDEIYYKVVRLFPIENNEVIQVVVTKRITQPDPLPLMRKVMQGVRATPQKVLNSHFPKEDCVFESDCY